MQVLQDDLLTGTVLTILAGTTLLFTKVLLL